MDISTLKRDRERISKVFKTMKDGSVIAQEDFEVYLPKRFVDSNLAEITDTVTTALVLGLVIPEEKAYAPLVGLANVTLHPISIGDVKIDNVNYVVLTFTKGDTFIQSTTVVEEPNQPYFYHMEFENYARKPFYLTRDDLTSLYDYAKIQCGKVIGTSPQVVRLFHSIMFRDPTNLDIPYRASQAMLDGKEPRIVGLNNSPMLVKGTFPKITGGYLQDNTMAAIVNPDDRVTELEKIIKGVPV